MASIFHMEQLRRELPRLACDPRAGAAVEFVLIFPVMIVLYIGSVEMGNLLTMCRRKSQVASTADLTAQVKTVSTSDLSDMTSAASSFIADGTDGARRSVIVAEVTYGFTPLVNIPQFFSPGSFDIKRTFYARPRKSLTVTKKN